MKPPLQLSSLEVLESRIAPAIILVGGPTSSGANDVNFNEAPFVNTEIGQDPISMSLGDGAPGVADTFYLRLFAGDTVALYNGSNGFDPFIIVRFGSAVAFFIDDPTAGVNQANEVEADELVGLSLGRGASVEVQGSVFGDIVTNLDDLGTSTRTDDLIRLGGAATDPETLIGSRQNIASLTIGANVEGGIYSGGSVTNVSIRGNVQEILAGTAADGATFDFFPGVEGGEGVIRAAAAAGVVGPSLSKIRVDSVTSRMEAGSGGFGAKGGSLASIQVTEDTDGFTLRAGDGGGAGGTRTGGGAGGDVTAIHIAGLADPTPNSAGGVQIFAGDGGDATNAGTGGAGGRTTGVFVGFELNGTTTVASGDPLKDAVLVQSGTGGDGRNGGAGGTMNDVRITVLTSELAGNEIEVRAGSGGAATNTTNGRAGLGGSITNVNVQNQDVGFFSDIEVHAGDGGAANAFATGARGGSITTASILGSEVMALAGDGSSGKTGGIGGSVTGLTFLQRDTIVTNKLQLDSGSGGDGAGGAAGSGGAISNIRIDSSDFTLLQINTGNSGDGGSSLRGRGGSGGLVNRVDVTDIDTGNGFNGAFTLRSGSGGGGTTGGGNGGAIDAVTLFGLNLEPTVTGGNGGAATVTGVGGRGATVSSVNLFADGQVQPLDPTSDPIDVSGAVTAGVGGTGVGERANGGVGGDVRTVNLNADLNVMLMAGNGGNAGTNGTSGKGGSVLTSGAFGTNGSGMLVAGDGGTTGIRAASGGSILGGTTGQLTALRVAETLTISAGDGARGGAGGSIRSVAFGSTSDSLTPTPNGNILVQAGNGSAFAALAGVGGSIDNLRGNTSSGLNTTTTIVGGLGGGSLTGTRSGAGGSVTNVSISGFGDDSFDPFDPFPTPGEPNPVLLTVAAGDAGVSPLASTGANGGSVRALAVSELDPDVTFRSVAAGDGSIGVRRGGVGGTIDGVNVVATVDLFGNFAGGDIGARRGLEYGYTSMGGLFAGAGGSGPTAGLAGSVRNISAESIAAIVAGRGAAPQLVERVERITLGTISGGDLLKASEQDFEPLNNGGDPNFRAYVEGSYATNNLVGAVVDPTREDANKYVAGISFTDTNANNVFNLGDQPIDGLIAARVFISSAPTNFIPEALLTGTGFFDHDNRI